MTRIRTVWENHTESSNEGHTTGRTEYGKACALRMDSPDAVWEGTNERGPGNARERQRNIPGTKALLCALAAMALFASLALVAACGSDGVADSTGGQATEQEGGNAATDQTGTQDGSQAQEPSNPGFVLEDTSTVTVDIADNDEEVDNDDANK